MSDPNQDAENYRSLIADYQEVFSTPSGQRVYEHLMDKILLRKTKCLYWTNAGPMFPNADRGMYFVALHDVAKSIEAMLEYDFTKMSTRPVVHHRRPNRG